jgi:hypothetical protein
VVYWTGWMRCVLQHPCSSTRPAGISTFNGTQPSQPLRKQLLKQ